MPVQHPRRLPSSFANPAAPRGMESLYEHHYASVFSWSLEDQHGISTLFGLLDADGTGGPDCRYEYDRGSIWLEMFSLAPHAFRLERDGHSLSLRPMPLAGEASAEASRRKSLKASRSSRPPARGRTERRRCSRRRSADRSARLCHLLTPGLRCALHKTKPETNRTPVGALAGWGRPSTQ